MNRSGIKKYYIGFIVLGIITLGIAIYTIAQGMSSKQDVETTKKANKIADSLNSYISKNRQIPESLDEADIKDVPSTVRYSKKSETQFEFCVTYKAAKSYGSNDITSVLWGAALRDSSNTEYDYYEDNYTKGSLSLPYSYKKGETCQTIEPYILRNNYNYNQETTPTSRSAMNVKSRDTERQTDIKALHGQIEAYYAQNGHYPSLANMNSNIFRSTNMKGLQTEALKDPVGKTATLSASPVRNYYSYAVTASDGKACDTAALCAKYTLTATLESGGTYTKSNLN